MAKAMNVSAYVKKSSKRGVAAKSKTSIIKTSKNYKKNLSNKQRNAIDNIYYRWEVYNDCE